MTPIVPIVVVHGGAGDVDPDRRAAHVEGCVRAAEEGLAVLLAGGSSLDAAIRSVELMEDDPVFNAGTGACLNAEGALELDASVMEGTTLRAGAVTVLSPFRHPIHVAREVLRDGKHVLYAAAGADAFAREHGFEPAPADDMITERARERLQKHLAGEVGEGWAGGTVGAVACDGRGRVACATSTGGTVGKRPGRVGDTPIIGAGTYADDTGGACSATGLGEAILRACLARTAVDLMAGGMAPEVAAAHAIRTLEERFSGSGGIVVVDALGRPGMAWNTRTMSHAIARAGDPARGGS
jgi:beta-aspartyl-peptidase (threonine type)